MSSEPEATCRAPFTSMYLDPRGFARVCAVNNGLPLGNVARTSLVDIWRGPVAEGLRSAFRAGAWGDGCEVCAWQAGANGRDQSFPATFDHLTAGGAEPVWPERLEFALGNTCNLRCVMCGGDLSSAIRARTEGFEPLPDVYDDRFYADLEHFAPHLGEARFLGGEPFLVPAHHRVWDLLDECGASPAVHVTTNGTIWNDRVEHVLDRFDTSVAVSIDGVRPETVERIRRGADHRRLMANLDRFVAYTRERGTHLGLTFCLMPENWMELGDFLAFADGLDVDVFVNLVTMPARFSLLRLPSEGLRGVVTGLEADRGPDGRGLGRNRRVWLEQLGQLRSRLDPPAGTPSIGWLRTTASRIEVAGAPVADLDVGELDRWSDHGPTALLELDDRDRVLTADPADRFLDLPVAAAGRGFDELIVLLSSYYGRRTETGWVRHRPDLEDRTARYETATAVTDLRSITRRPAPGRVRMALTARRGPIGQPVGVRSATVSGATTPSHGSIS